MDILLLTFANSESDPLPKLREEDDKTHAVLRERTQQQDFRLEREQFATREKVINLLKAHRQDICLFWYSGHADYRLLQMEDGPANADGIAALLGQCPKLILVGLNGCSTLAQTDALLAAGVPMVIATSDPVDDDVATKFSIAFFTELAKNRRSVREAFESAVKEAQVYGKTTIKAQVRSAGREREPSEDGRYWELVVADKQESLLDSWRLPERKSDVPVNQHLRKALRLLFNTQHGDYNRADAPLDTLLKSLPFTISEPLRNLLAPNDGTRQVFFDRPGPERRSMLLYAYRGIGNFLTYALWSRLWALRAAGKELQNLEPVWNDFRQWLCLNDIREDKRRSLFPVFQRLAWYYHQNGLELPLPELPEALKKMTDHRYQEAFDYLEARLQEPEIGREENWERLCEETEKRLAQVLHCFGFLFRYTLTSIKAIDVEFYMHLSAPIFVHKVVRLQAQTTPWDEQLEKYECYLKTASVLLRPVDNSRKEELYLSPFLIDENAYLRTDKANPYFCMAWHPAQRSFIFRNISRPEDDILTIQEPEPEDIFSETDGEDTGDNFFPLIYGQFNAFCETVFGKNLDEL
ncbi:MAG: CHAT domain-containing protein [Saprospiraceae bacterium]|nr:CHAT domain-containing protein [Saprospiraceae bacterium]